MRNVSLLSFSMVLCAACAGRELARKPPPLAAMEEPLERMQPPDDETARLALPKGSFTGLVVGDARASLDAMLGEPQGVLVENSPADAAGIEAGDLVLEARASETLVLHWPSEWRALELATPPGTTLSLVLDRAGAERECALTTIARVRAAERGTSERIREEERVGVVLRTATEVEARAAGLGPGGGAVVVGLARESPWREAGLVFGDLIRALDGVLVADPAVVVDHIRSAPEDGELELELVRAGARLTLSARVSARAHEWNEIWIPLLFHHEKERDESSTSALLGLFRYVSTPAAWRLRLLWLLRFSGGDADRLESVAR